MERNNGTPTEPDHTDPDLNPDADTASGGSPDEPGTAEDTTDEDTTDEHDRPVDNPSG